MPATTVYAGFIPLVDCAVLAVAAERGFAAREGLDLRLSREVSWANIRDKLNLGYLNCAHVLAGMPIAASLGIGHVTVPMVAPYALGINGNAITVSTALFDAMAAHLPAGGPPDAADAGAALRSVVTARDRAGQPPLTFAMVFPFSSHNYQLRYWMAAAGIDPDRDVRLVVIPPPYMVDSLRAGHIDGFCVGEPWSSLAVAQGIGAIVATGSDIWPLCPEKVLGVRQAWAEERPDALKALLRALDAAAAWAEAPENRDALAALLGGPAYLDLPPETILPALSGALPRRPGGPPEPAPDFLLFHRRETGRPRTDHALWLYSQMVRWGQVAPSDAAEATAARTYRPDLYDAALPADRRGAGAAADLPPLFDAMPFDPRDIGAYLRRLAIKHILRKI